MTVWTQYLTHAHLWYGNSSKPFLWGYLFDLNHGTGKKESRGVIKVEKKKEFIGITKDVYIVLHQYRNK